MAEAPNPVNTEYHKPTIAQFTRGDTVGDALVMIVVRVAVLLGVSYGSYRLIRLGRTAERFDRALHAINLTQDWDWLASVAAAGLVLSPLNDLLVRADVRAVHTYFERKLRDRDVERERLIADHAQAGALLDQQVRDLKTQIAGLQERYDKATTFQQDLLARSYVGTPGSGGAAAAASLGDSK